MKTTIKSSIFLLVLLALTGLPGTGSAASPPTPEALMSRIQTAYKQVASLSATFEQTVAQVAFARTYQASGQLRYATGKLRWDYYAPDPQTYVVAGNHVYWVQPSERQVIRMQLGEAFESHHAVASLLGGMDELDLYFTASQVEQQDRYWVLTAIPKFDNPQIAQVQLTFDDQQGFVRVVEIADAFGNMNRIALDNINKQAKVAPEVFSQPVPRGYKLMVYGE